MSILASISAASLVLVLCGLVSLHHIVRSVQTFVRLRRFNGSIWACLSSWQHSRALLQYRPGEWYAEMIEKHGPIVKIAPNLLVTSCPDAWAHINTKPGYKRSEWFFRAMRVDYQHDHLFSLTDNAEHDRRRKLLTPGFYGTDNSKLEISVNECLEDLLNLIRSKYISSTTKIVPVDMATKVQYFTHDTISTVTFGRAFGMVQNDTDVRSYIQSTKEGFLMGNAILALGLTKLSQMSFIGELLSPSPKDKTGYGNMLGFCISMMEKRATNPADNHDDMLGSFIRQGMSGNELRSEILDAIVIGSFGPCHVICAALLLVTTNPYVYSKLCREIDNAVRDGRAPPTDKGIITFAQTRQLPYLQATIRETLRFMPPTVGLFPRDVPPGGDVVTINNKPIFLPGGACIGRSVYSMVRSKEIYGDDANTFRPERWFESDSAKLANMVRVNEMIFNHGRFQCVGRVIAHTEIGKTVFELLRNFEFALLDPSRRPWKAVDMFGILGISDFWVQIRERVST